MTSPANPPLRERKLDMVLIGWFFVNLVFIVYTMDVEVLVISDTSDFEYPAWPPAFIVDAAHFWGANYDPLLMARPAWFRAMIWIDVILFGPFYAAAIYAFKHGRRWIRLPSVMYATAMIIHVGVILFAELVGTPPAPEPAISIAVYGSYLVLPALLLYRVWPESFFAPQRPSTSMT